MLKVKKAEITSKESDRQVHACDWRLRKCFPDQEWDFEVYDQKHY